MKIRLLRNEGGIAFETIEGNDKEVYGLFLQMMKILENVMKMLHSDFFFH